MVTRRAFTLVELMIVVAIIGILASVAVPNYQVFVLRAKKSEAYVCLDGVRTAEYAYEAAFDTFIEVPINPDPPLQRIQRDWDLTKQDWVTLDWEPTGAVRCAYEVQTWDANSWFTATAYCDIDGDGQTAIIKLNSWHSTSAGTFEEPYHDRF
jgi:prepilin-type N-terminal cleavage/methylation domain-containing protein